MLNAWQHRFGHTFADPRLLETALTHSSYANEQELAYDNERLEYLGDAVLELAVSHELYARFPQSPEGVLTRLRSRLVKEKTLAQVARELDLPSILLLGRGEETQGGRERDALLADALEAVFGATFLDGGFKAAQSVILRHLGPLIPDTPDLPATKDPKTRLQETMQQRHKRRPVYSQVRAHGPDHSRLYEVEVRLPDGACFAATAGSMKKAEQMAAQAALDALDETGATDAPGNVIPGMDALDGRDDENNNGL